MKHAGEAALAGVAGLLALLRQRPGLVEKRPGVFYRRSQAFLHFHEDPAGLFVDIKAGDDWLRLPLLGEAAWEACLAEVDRCLG
jgi:hypothetical protein